MRRPLYVVVTVGCLFGGSLIPPNGASHPVSIPEPVAAAVEIRPVVPPVVVPPTSPPVTARSTTSRPSRGLERRTTPPPVVVAVDGDDVLTRIMRCESGGNPTARNTRSGASGLFQYLRATWNGYGGFLDAADAPAETQWARARADLARIGTRPWVASRACWAR